MHFLEIGTVYSKKVHISSTSSSSQVSNGITTYKSKALCDPLKQQGFWQLTNCMSCPALDLTCKWPLKLAQLEVDVNIVKNGLQLFTCEEEMEKCLFLGGYWLFLLWHLSWVIVAAVVSHNWLVSHFWKLTTKVLKSRQVYFVSMYFFERIFDI